MPQLRLTRREIRDFEPPNVCAVCGKPAGHVIQKTFRWSPEWTMALVVIGALVFHLLLIVGVILAFTLAKTMTVPMPVCDRHKAYWGRRMFWTYGPISILFFLGFVELVVLIILSGQNADVEVVGFACGGTALLFLVALIAAAITQRGTIRADHMTDSDVLIGRLSKEYVAAMVDQRIGSRGRLRDRDWDDEFDDRPVRRQKPEPVNDEHRESFRADREDRPRPPRDDRDTFRAEPGD